MYELLKQNTIATALGITENFERTMQQQLGESIILKEQDVGGIFLKRKIQTNTSLDKILHKLRFFKVDYQPIEL